MFSTFRALFSSEDPVIQELLPSSSPNPILVEIAGAPFPQGLKVGDRIQVRDCTLETWEAGTVAEIDDAGGLRVLRDGFESAYYWDEMRPLPTSGELQRETQER
jgi:hypothetical protein